MRTNRQNIFLTWGGEIYGPSSEEDVIAGVRTSSFDEEALYWHEGMKEWKPVYEFATPPSKQWQRVNPRNLPTAPRLPEQVPGANSRRRRPRRSRTSKPASQRIGNGGRAIFLGIVVLAVLLTVGILLLLMRV